MIRASLTTELRDLGRIMSSDFSNLKIELELPIEKNLVFDTFLHVVPKIKGLKISSSDKVFGWIVVKSGESLFSWGENIPIYLKEIDKNNTKVKITSSPKIGLSYGGGWHEDHIRKNMQEIISAAYGVLQAHA